MSAETYNICHHHQRVQWIYRHLWCMGGWMTFLVSNVKLSIFESNVHWGYFSNVHEGYFSAMLTKYFLQIHCTDDVFFSNVHWWCQTKLGHLKQGSLGRQSCYSFLCKIISLSYHRHIIAISLSFYRHVILILYYPQNFILIILSSYHCHITVISSLSYHHVFIKFSWIIKNHDKISN